MVSAEKGGTRSPSPPASLTQSLTLDSSLEAGTQSVTYSGWNSYVVPRAFSAHLVLTAPLLLWLLLPPMFSCRRSQGQAQECLHAFEVCLLHLGCHLPPHGGLCPSALHSQQHPAIPAEEPARAFVPVELPGQLALPSHVCL